MSLDWSKHATLNICKKCINFVYWDQHPEHGYCSKRDTELVIENVTMELRVTSRKPASSYFVFPQDCPFALEHVYASE